MTATKNRKRAASPRSGSQPRTARATVPRPGPEYRAASGRGGSGRRPRTAALSEARRADARRRALRARVLWSAAVVVIAATFTAMALAARGGSTQARMDRLAPAFTLHSTSGTTVNLASYRGHDVVLYFSEGVGCGACFDQMREFQRHADELRRAGITVVPIVMNPAGQVRQEMTAYGIRTSYLIDATGSVSRAYGVLGKGMHAGLPGHGFVLIDARGIERWYGEYPSMYLSTADLIKQVRAHLG